MPDHWTHHAACRGRRTEYWFPDKPGTQDAATRLALSICKTCPVNTDCYNHALNRPEYFGIWGGTTEQQRRGIRNRATSTIPHGTAAGYQRHRQWGEQPCTACRTANANYVAALRNIARRANTRDTWDPADQ